MHSTPKKVRKKKKAAHNYKSNNNNNNTPRKASVQNHRLELEPGNCQKTYRNSKKKEATHITD